MSHPYAALCGDFYINQRLNLKMDLPMRRETVLGLFDRLRRQFPSMDRFRRYENELALESHAEADIDSGYRWVGVRRTSVRSGTVNPPSEREAFELHAGVLETAPAYLDITALDVENIELLYGFDLPASGNHDAIVLGALYAGSPLAALTDADDDLALMPTDCQPLIGVSLDAMMGPSPGIEPGAGSANPPSGRTTAHLEIKTRSRSRRQGSGGGGDPAATGGASSDWGLGTGGGGGEPISMYLVVRRSGTMPSLDQLPVIVRSMAAAATHLLESRVLPRVLTPLREAIASGA